MMSGDEFSENYVLNDVPHAPKSLRENKPTDFNSNSGQWDGFDLFPKPPSSTFACDGCRPVSFETIAGQVSELQHEFHQIKDTVQLLQTDREKISDTGVQNKAQRTFHELHFLIEAEIAERVELKTKCRSIARQLKDFGDELRYLKQQVQPMLTGHQFDLSSPDELCKNEGVRRGSFALSTRSRNTSLRHPIPSLPVPLDDTMEKLWSALVVAVQRVPDSDGTESRVATPIKDPSKNIQLRIFFSGESGYSFGLGIDGTFSRLFRDRPWMPLGFKQSRVKGGDPYCALTALPSAEMDPEKWTKEFLTKKCIAYDATGNKIIYVALQNEELAVEEITQFEVSPSSANIFRDDWFNADESDHYKRNNRENNPTKPLSQQTFSKASAILGYSSPEPFSRPVSQVDRTKVTSPKTSITSDDYTSATQVRISRASLPSASLLLPRFTSNMADHQNSSEKRILRGWRIKSPTFFSRYSAKM